VTIFAKMMTFTTLHQVKAIPGYNMLLEAHERGELDDVTTVIENSSGNTVSAIAIAARLFGIDDIKAIVPTEVSAQKLQMLQFFGISPIVNQEPKDPSKQDPSSGIYKAKALGRQEGWFNPGQYDNKDNPAAHRKWIGAQIWDQTGGEIDVFCGALGTTGTIVGNSQYLKEKCDEIQIVGVVRAPDNYVPGPRTEKALNLIGFDWRPHVDSITEATNPQAYLMSMQLSRHGLFVGPSAGLSLVGLIAYLDDRKADGTLDELRSEAGDIVCVFVCPDTPMPYFDEYFQYVDESHFPDITNEDLLPDTQV
jgi:cysteine synthase